MANIDGQKENERRASKNITSEAAIKENLSAQTPQTVPTRDIDDPDARFIYIQPDIAVAVDKTTGEILGQHGEGTLGIILYSGNPKDRIGKRYQAEKAIRIPRLLQSDELLNFHVAEIVYHESRQAKNFANSSTLLGAFNFYRLDQVSSYAVIPGDANIPEQSSAKANTQGTGHESSEGFCYIGIYLSPLSHYKLCLVSKRDAWPPDFRRHLSDNDIQVADLFNEIATKCRANETPYKPETARVSVFNNLLYLPDRPGKSNNKGDNTNEAAQSGDAKNKKAILSELSRETLEKEHAARRDIGGWWFNIPIAIYPWMTANLERLLTAYVDAVENDNDANVNSSEPDADAQSKPSLRKWVLSSWLELIEQLATGLNELHQSGGIHGDPRPANIMTNIHSEPDFRARNFKWIDIGLGYGARDVIREGKISADEESVVSPRPLGGGRTTIFYAPEREEASEFEDADVVLLTPAGPEKSELSFHWRERSHRQPTRLPLKRGNTPLRELGKLMKGDRVQVREFLFEVDEVKEDSIIVSTIYEIYLDRVLVEKKEDQRRLVHDRLQFAEISRYRIFQQWGQATDVYSLGMITLYLFFLKGLHEMKAAPIPTASDSPDNLLGRNPLRDRANRERTFSELAALLRNRSFLENILSVFRKELPYAEVLWQVPRLEPGFWLFRPSDFSNLEDLIVKLKDNNNSISQYLKSKFTQETQQLIEGNDGTSAPLEAIQAALISEFDRLISGPSLYEEESYAELKLSEWVRELITQNPQGKDLILLNRALIEEAFPQEITKSQETFAKAAEKISQEILFRDVNFIFVRRGLNANDGLFVRLIYFCLSCLWRQEEVDEILRDGSIKFKPFCATRRMLKKQQAAAATAKALSILDPLITIGRTSPFRDNGLPDFIDPDALLRSRENQWINNLTQAKERIIKLENTLSSLSQDIERVHKLFNEIYTNSSDALQQWDNLWFFESKKPIKQLVKNIGEKAKDGKNLKR